MKEGCYLSVHQPAQPLPFSQSRAHYTDILGMHRLQRRLRVLIASQTHRQHILLCIGSDRSTGDSLGPLTGTKLDALAPANISILGTLDNPIDAHNLEATMSAIAERFPNPFVIALDATLGQAQSVGYITLSLGSFQPGTAGRRRLPYVGDIHLTGVVNTSSPLHTLVLRGTRLSLVWRLSDYLCDMFESIPYYQIYRP